MRLNRWVLIAVVFLITMLIIFPGAKEKTLTIGDVVPDFRAIDLNGDYFFYNDYRSNVVLLNFSATWCAYCLEELPYLEKLNKKYRDQGLIIVTVFQDYQNIDLIKEIIDKNNISYLVVTDEKGKISKLFGVVALPFSVIIDRNSVIRYSYIGFVAQDIERYECTIRNLLQENAIQRK